MGNFMASWRTAFSGIAAFVSALGFAVQTMTDSDPLTNPDWNIVAAAFWIMVGLVTARDNQTTSEEAGAKK